MAKKKRSITRAARYGTFDTDHYIFNTNDEKGFYEIRYAGGAVRRQEKLNVARRVVAKTPQNLLMRVPDTEYKPGKFGNGSTVKERPYSADFPIKAHKESARHVARQLVHFVKRFVGGEEVLIDTETHDVYVKSKQPEFFPRGD